MNFKKRFSILAGIFAAFTIIAATVIIFTLGYTFDFSAKKFVATGTLMVYSEPRGAEIFLNNKKTGKTAPATLRMLPPGDYDLSLRKAGYEPWEKRFSILPQQVTWTSPPNGKVVLFLSAHFPVLTDEKASNVFLLDGKAWSATATSTLLLKQADTSESLAIKLPFKNTPDNSVSITPDGNWAIVASKQGVKWATAINLGLTADLEKFGLEFTSVRSFGETDLILQNQDGALYQYNIESRVLSPRRNSSSAYAVYSDRLYFIDGNSAYAAGRSSSTTEIIAQNLPGEPAVSLAPTESGGLYAIFGTNLYRLDPKPQLLARDVDNAVWDKKSQALLFYNSHAIWVFTPETDSAPQLITRSSETVSQPQINSDSGQVYYLEAGIIKAAETYAATRRIVEFKSAGRNVAKFFINQEGTTLYSLMPGSGLFLTKIR